MHTCLVFLESALLPFPHAGWAPGQVCLPSGQVCLGPSWREASCTVTNQDPFVGGQAEAALKVVTMSQVFLAGTEWLVRFPKSRYPAERPGDCLECPVSAVLTALGQLSCHLLLPMNMLSLVCIYAQEGPWEPFVSRTVPSFSLLHRWAALKVKPAPSGTCKGKWMGFPHGDGFSTSSAQRSLTRAVHLSTQGQAWGGAMAVACPTLWGHKVRQGKDHLSPYGRAAPSQGTGY